MFMGLRNEIVVDLTWMLCARQCRAFNHSEKQLDLQIEKKGRKTKEK